MKYMAEFFKNNNATWTIKFAKTPCTNMVYQSMDK